MADLIPTMTSNTTPSGVVSALGSYSFYSAWKAVMDDNSDSTKSWVNLQGYTAGWLQYEFPSAQVVRKYTITSRNEALYPRSPKAWSLLAMPTPFDEIPTMSSNIAPSGVASASREDFGYSAWYAMMDNNTHQAYSWVAAGTAAWLQYQFVSAKTIVRYTITSRNEGAASRVPKSWSLKASNTGAFGGEEVTLDTQTNITDWASSGNVKKEFTFSNSTAYLYYRLDITASNDAFVGVGEFELSESVPVTLNSQSDVTDWATTPNEKKEYEISNDTAYKYYRLDITESNDANYVGVGEFELIDTGAERKSSFFLVFPNF